MERKDQEKLFQSNLNLKKVNYLRWRQTPIDGKELLDRLIDAGWYKRYLLYSKWNIVDMRSQLMDALIAEYVNSRNARGMFIYGNIGVGKTSLLTLIGQFLLKNYEGWACYLPATVLFTKLIKGIQQELDDIRLSTFLFIDDLGKEYDTDFPLSRFSELIEYRWANEKPTFVSSNLDLESIRKKAGYEHIADRLNDDSWMLHFYYAGETKRIRRTV